MQTSIGSVSRMPYAAPQQREAVHDLRNLFGIIASARQLLEHDPVPPRRRAILDALGDAVLRGSRLTTHLLTPPAPAVAQSIDVGERLSSLAPMMQALADARVTLDLQVGFPHARVRMIGDQFDAAVMELVTNALVAGASSVIVRNRQVGARIWTLVSDDGRGMSASTCAWARSGLDAGTAHGGGLSHVHRFARMAHGHLYLRSRRGTGTTIALVLPVLLGIGRTGRDARAQRIFPKPEEKTNEQDGQRIAA